MSQSVILELSDKAWSTLQSRAQATGISPADLAAASIERQFDGSVSRTEAENQHARERFESHFGEVDLEDATGADNASIDADLAREYGSPHASTGRN
jgi:hypothetical protein